MGVRVLTAGGREVVESCVVMYGLEALLYCQQHCSGLPKTTLCCLVC